MFTVYCNRSWLPQYRQNGLKIFVEITNQIHNHKPATVDRHCWHCRHWHWRLLYLRRVDAQLWWPENDSQSNYIYESSTKNMNEFKRWNEVVRSLPKSPHFYFPQEYFPVYSTITRVLDSDQLCVVNLDSPAFVFGEYTNYVLSNNLETSLQIMYSRNHWAQATEAYLS